jgi:hypothetical protein
MPKHSVWNMQEHMEKIGFWKSKRTYIYYSAGRNGLRDLMRVLDSIFSFPRPSGLFHTFCLIGESPLLPSVLILIRNLVSY